MHARTQQLGALLTKRPPGRRLFRSRSPLRADQRRARRHERHAGRGPPRADRPGAVPDDRIDGHAADRRGLRHRNGGRQCRGHRRDAARAGRHAGVVERVLSGARPRRACGHGRMLGDGHHRSASRPNRRCARPTGARTSSWPSWRTSCATRWRRSATPAPSSSSRCAGPQRAARELIERQGPPGAPARRPARREPHHPRQARAAPRAVLARP